MDIKRIEDKNTRSPRKNYYSDIIRGETSTVIAFDIKA